MIIFVPATLCEQWQTELLDKLGIPTARWQTTRKVWLDSNERSISPAGAEHIAACPLRIGIVSTGLMMMRDSNEKQHLLDLSYGLVILDEAHKARSRQGFGKNAGEPNELLGFITAIVMSIQNMKLFYTIWSTKAGLSMVVRNALPDLICATTLIYPHPIGIGGIALMYCRNGILAL